MQRGQSIAEHLAETVDNRKEAARSASAGRKGERLSYRKISAELSKAGHKNERGEPYNPKSIKAMIDS